jgi:NAD(P)-dependent dehydrogenase (short-subunit alcohol dehydrogenase family)
MAGVLQDKVALITGGGRGVGRGLALALAAEGARIFVCGRTAEPLQEVVDLVAERGSKAASHVCDVTNADDLTDLVARTVAEFGTIDILINNANVPVGGLLLDTDDQTYINALMAGPVATLRLMKLCHPYLKGGGTIINLVTGASLRSDPIGYGGYVSQKDAMRGLSRTAAVEWGPDGIRVHAIAPLAGLETWIEHYPEEAAAYMAQIPLGRIGNAETDIGPVVVFLCSDASRYMTGNVIMIDGGKEYLR